MYKIEVAPAALRDLEKLKGRIRKADFERLRDSIRLLAEQPRPQGVRKIKGADNAYRIRIGNYRIVYDLFEAGKLVLIIQIVRRSETTYSR